MKDRISARQRGAWSLAASSVPAVMVCAGRPWTQVLLGSMLAAVMAVVLGTLCKKNGLGLCESYRAAFGGLAGRVLLLLTALWTLMTLANTAPGATAAFPGGETDLLAPVVLLLLAALAVRKGVDAAARCAAVAAPVLAGLYLLLLAAALPGLKTSWCVPWQDSEAALDAGASMLLPCAALFLTEWAGEETHTPGLLWIVLLPAAMALTAAGNLSPAVTREEALPFYTLTKSLRLLSVMERFEPVLSAALYLGLFCMAALLCAACEKTLVAALGFGRAEWLPFALCAAGYGLSFAARGLPQAVWSAGATVFWGGIPVLAQLVVAIKKVRKKAKKGVDKRDLLW